MEESARVVGLEEGPGAAVRTDRSGPLMTPPQLEYLRSVAKRVHGERQEAYLAQLRSHTPQPTRAQASSWISRLEGRARSRRPPATLLVVTDATPTTRDALAVLAASRPAVVLVATTAQAQQLGAEARVVTYRTVTTVMRDLDSTHSVVDVVDHDPARTSAWARAGLLVYSTVRDATASPHPELPRSQHANTDLVPEGSYALGAEPDLRFYRIDRPTEGRWAGRVFVNVIHGERETPVRGVAARQVLTGIAIDPLAAALRYGIAIGRCSRCGRKLTVPTSRERGIGPDCLEKFGR